MSANFDCEVTASFLDSGRVLTNAAHAAGIAAAVGAVFATGPAQRALFAVSLCVWPAACWWGMRVAIDASLFRALRNDPANGGKHLDHFLVSNGLAKASSDRPIADRCRGALRLWRYLMLAAAVQIAAAVSALLLRLAGV